MSTSHSINPTTGPAFSIITATYNARDLLVRTIESLRSQSFTDFEWIVVDGASQDNTVELVKQAGDVVHRFICEPDDGIADAWNKGINEARGRYVLILNAGDTYDPDFLKLINNDCDGKRIICSHTRVLAEEGRQVALFKAEPRKLNRGMHLPHNWCAVPSRFYREMGPYKKMPLAMDFEWFHRYYKAFGPAGFKVIDRPLGNYFLGGKSDSNYRESFKTNEAVLLQSGTHPVLARLIRVSYTFKHGLRRMLVSRG
jgi:glycosyltransferase involved in cell wall biosynthesis